MIKIEDAQKEAGYSDSPLDYGGYEPRVLSVVCRS